MQMAFGGVNKREVLLAVAGSKKVAIGGIAATA
jgi:hypothetical protein